MYLSIYNIMLLYRMSRSRIIDSDAETREEGELSPESDRPGSSQGRIHRPFYIWS